MYFKGYVDYWGGDLTFSCHEHFENTLVLTFVNFYLFNLLLLG